MRQGDTMSSEPGFPGAENGPQEPHLPAEPGTAVSPPPAPPAPRESDSGFAAPGSAQPHAAVPAPYTPPAPRDADSPPAAPGFGQPEAGIPAPYAPPYTPPSGGAGYAIPGQYAQHPGQQLIAPKNPALGVIISFFIPGVGSMVNGSVGRGVLILVSYIISCLLIVILIGIPLAIGVWIWGLADGYLSAQRWNRAHGIIS